MNKLALWVGLGCLLLALFHFESVSIGPLKVSHLWKGALLSFLIIKIFSRGRLKRTVYTPFLVLALLILFSLEIIYNPLNAIFTYSTTVVLPLIGIYALRMGSAWSRKALHFLSAFFILCFIPYEVGILAPLGEGYDLERSYGMAVKGSIGPFQTVHSASTALAGAILVVLYFWLTSAYNRMWLTFLFILGFYLLFNTYVRTGMAMFAIGALIMLGSAAVRSSKMLIRVAFLTAAMVPMVGGWVLTNDGLMARILGESARGSESVSFETLGSGRGGLALDAWNIYIEASLVGKVIGMGISEQKRRMGEKRGSELIPHNGFLAVLLHFGVVGFLLFLWFIVSFWRATGHFAVAQDVIFLRSIFSAYLVAVFFQQFDMFYILVLVMLAYAWKCNLSGAVDGCEA